MTMRNVPLQLKILMNRVEVLSKIQIQNFIF